MHSTSDLWKQILVEPNHQKQHKITINGNEYDESRIIRASVTGQLFDAPSVGNCFSRTLDLTVMPLDGANGAIPPLSEIKLFTRLVSADGQSVSEYVQKGVFYADTVKRDSDTGAVTVTAFDAMMKMEALFGEPANGGSGGYVPVRYFTVSFNDGFQHIQKFRVASGGAMPTPTTPTRSGEKFLAWYPDPANTPTVKGDMRFTAQWARKFAVTFDSNGGTPQAPQTFVCFDGDPTPTPETPEKAGYALSGWTPTPTETVTADTAYYAQWASIVSVAITSYPEKTDYISGEPLDLTGLLVTASLSDGSTLDVTEDCATIPAAGTAITQSGSVTVTYGGMAAGIFDITALGIIASGEGWTLYDDGTLDVHFVGDMPDYTMRTTPPPDYTMRSTAPWYDYRKKIRRVTIGDDVTHIGDFAFLNIDNRLYSVTIPNSVTSIGEGAFNGCFFLTSVTIPNSVTSIGSGAFANCNHLTSVTIPNSVTSIGDSAFNNCSSLTSIAIPDGVTNIREYFCFLCTSLTSVTIPNSVTSIGEGAFQDCRKLSRVTIPRSVVNIGTSAFIFTKLTSVTISGNATVGATAFPPNCVINYY